MASKFTGDNMFEDAFSFEKLLKAYKRCRCSKQHKKDVITFEINLSQNLTELSRNILTQKYNLGRYKQFFVYEPKKRNIEALSFKDRIVLMSLCSNLIEPKIEKKLIYDNVACRKNKGTFFGLERLKFFLTKFYNINKNNEGYFLKCDIRKYFPSINHDVLKNLLARADFDEKTMWLLNKIIDSHHFETGVGLPIGNQTSQWFALYYLSGVDRLIKEKLKIKYYVRYMDDMILVHKDKDYLKYCKTEIENYCQNVLKLELNEKTQISKLANGIDFLGFRTILLKNGKILRFLRGQAKRRLKKRIKFISIVKKEKLADDEFVKIRLNAYNAHLCHSNSLKLLYFYRKKYNV